MFENIFSQVIKEADSPTYWPTPLPANLYFSTPESILQETHVTVK